MRKEKGRRNYLPLGKELVEWSEYTIPMGSLRAVEVSYNKKLEIEGVRSESNQRNGCPGQQIYYIITWGRTLRCLVSPDTVCGEKNRKNFVVHNNSIIVIIVKRKERRNKETYKS